MKKCMIAMAMTALVSSPVYSATATMVPNYEGQKQGSSVLKKGISAYVKYRAAKAVAKSAVIIAGVGGVGYLAYKVHQKNTALIPEKDLTNEAVLTSFLHSIRTDKNAMNKSIEKLNNDKSMFKLWQRKLIKTNVGFTIMRELGIPFELHDSSTSVETTAEWGKASEYVSDLITKIERKQNPEWACKSIINGSTIQKTIALELKNGKNATYLSNIRGLSLKAGMPQPMNGTTVTSNNVFKIGYYGEIKEGGNARGTNADHIPSFKSMSYYVGGLTGSRESGHTSNLAHRAVAIEIMATSHRAFSRTYGSRNKLESTWMYSQKKLEELKSKFTLDHEYQYNSRAMKDSHSMVAATIMDLASYYYYWNAGNAMMNPKEQVDFAEATSIIYLANKAFCLYDQ